MLGIFINLTSKFKNYAFRRSFDKGRNGFTSGQFQGVFISENSRINHVSGETFDIEFQIVDKRKQHKLNSFYKIEVFFQYFRFIILF